MIKIFKEVIWGILLALLFVIISGLYAYLLEILLDQLDLTGRLILAFILFIKFIAILLAIFWFTDYFDL